MFEYKGLKAFYGSQIFFSTKLAYPLFKVLDEAFDLDFCSNIDRNVEQIKKLIAETQE